MNEKGPHTYAVGLTRGVYVKLIHKVDEKPMKRFTTSKRAFKVNTTPKTIP